VTGYLLDTNVVSAFRRAKQDERAVSFVAAQPMASLYLSVVSLAELRYGIERLEDLTKREDLKAWLNTRVRPMFDGRILPVSEDVMATWRVLVERGRRINHTFSQPDLIIAATALHHGLTIMTRDTHDFARTGVAYVNPWAEPA
jgi:hypothetical protein